VVGGLRVTRKAVTVLDAAAALRGRDGRRLLVAEIVEAVRARRAA